MHLGARLDGCVVAQRDTGGAATPAHVGASLVRVRVRVRVRVGVRVGVGVGVGVGVIGYRGLWGSGVGVAGPGDAGPRYPDPYP